MSRLRKGEVCLLCDCECQLYSSCSVQLCGFASRLRSQRWQRSFCHSCWLLSGLGYTQWKCYVINPQTAPILWAKDLEISLKARGQRCVAATVLVSIGDNVLKSIISVLRSGVRCELDSQQAYRRNQFCLSGVVFRAGIALSLSLWGLVQIQARFRPLATTPSVAPSIYHSARTLTHSLCVFILFHIYSCWEEGLVKNNLEQFN